MYNQHEILGICNTALLRLNEIEETLLTLNQLQYKDVSKLNSLKSCYTVLFNNYSKLYELRNCWSVDLVRVVSDTNLFILEAEYLLNNLSKPRG